MNYNTYTFMKNDFQMHKPVHFYLLISSFHRALLQSVTFISRLMHSVIQNVDVKIYVV